MADIITSPIKFLGATVLSFNTSIGLGSAAESTLSVELVEDCDNGDIFLPAVGGIEVGQEVYFNCGTFAFGGILTSWTKTLSTSGKTFSVKAADPRQLLDNFAISLDMSDERPEQNKNYANLWTYFDNPANQFKCKDYGLAQTCDRGMKYRQIITGLKQINPIIYSPTGYQFTVDFSSFPGQNDGLIIPDFYRISGPSISILGLLQNVCDILGYEFYVDLLPGNIIKIGLINLKQIPNSFAGIFDAYSGTATDLSYGQELRNDKTKAIIFGEKMHINNEVISCDFYFGIDIIPGPNNTKKIKHIIPFKYDTCGFWINKMVTNLNVSMHTPLEPPPPLANGNGPFTISEFDIRAAMSSMQLWKERVFSPDIPGTFNAAVRQRFPESVNAIRTAINNIEQNNPRAMADIHHNPDLPNKELEKYNKQDIDKVYNFIKQLGDTYYGREFLVPISTCYSKVDDLGVPANRFTAPDNGAEPCEFMFTKEPTNAGGWAEKDEEIIGLKGEDLNFFRSDDGRVCCFSQFAIELNKDPEEWYITSSGKNPPEGKNGCYECQKGPGHKSASPDGKSYKSEADCKKALEDTYPNFNCE